MVFLLWTVFAVIIAGCALLLLPVRITVHAAGDTAAGFRGSVRVMPLAGLAGVGGEYSAGKMHITVYLGTWGLFTIDAGRFSSGDRKKRKAKEPKEKPSESSAGHGPEPLSGRVERWKVKANEYRYYTGIGIRALRSLVRVEGWTIRVRFGLGDPALTGRLAGFVYALNGALPERFNVTPEWDFTQKTCSGEGEAVFTFRTYMLWIVLVREIRAYLARRGEWTIRPLKTPNPREA